MQKALPFMLYALVIAGCTPFWEAERLEYGNLGLRVAEMPKVMNYVWMGDDPYPFSLSTMEFMDSLQVRMPKEYSLLSNYIVDFNGYGKYYVLKVYDCNRKALIMYDYSCTQGLDGPVYQDPKRYIFTKYKIPDECKSR